MLAYKCHYKYDDEKRIISKIKYRFVITTCINGAFYVIIKLYNCIPTRKI